MKTKSLFMMLAAFSFLLSGCPSGGPSYRLVFDHKVCGTDQKLEKLGPGEAQEFFNLLAPIADLDRATLQAPRPDDGKLERPEVQKKIVADLRERCNFDERDALGKEFENQTFKFGKKLSVDKKAEVKCPLKIDETIVPLKESPAFVGKPTTTRTAKATAAVSWTKQDPNYKYFGKISSIELKGTAETFFYKKLPTEQADPGYQNMLLTVDEQYTLTAGLEGNFTASGHYTTCRKLQEDNDIKTNKPNVRFDVAVTRIGLKTDKIKGEGKFIVVWKLFFDEKTQSWVRDRTVRNDFYINDVLLSTEDIATLENKRRETIGFKP